MEGDMFGADERAILQLIEVLAGAERTRVAAGPVSDLVAGGITLEMAHRVCEGTVHRRATVSEQIAGFKVGSTTTQERDNEDLRLFAYGYLLDSMVLTSGGILRMDEFISTKIETEIFFRLSHGLTGSQVSVGDVLEATDAVGASFEVADARIRDWTCPYPDFVADNAFAARIVLGGSRHRVGDTDLSSETATLLQDGRPIASGTRESALGHPASAVAWLARALSERGRHLSAGMVIMTGTLTPSTPIVRGSTYVGQFSTLGRVEISFV